MMPIVRTTTRKMRVTGFFVSLALLLVLSACAPQREFVQFSDAGTFHPGHGQGGGDRGEPQGEYDSYELIDHGAPNQGIAPMYQGNQNGYQQGYQPQPRGHGGGGYPAVVETYDQYGNPRNVIVPNPW
jgi:hypothetical protein